MDNIYRIKTFKHITRLIQLSFQSNLQHLNRKQKKKRGHKWTFQKLFACSSTEVISERFICALWTQYVCSQCRIICANRFQGESLKKLSRHITASTLKCCHGDKMMEMDRNGFHIVFCVNVCGCLCRFFWQVSKMFWPLSYDVQKTSNTKKRNKN